MPDRLSTAYINSADYKTLEDKLKELKSNLDDLQNKTESARKLRYSEVDIEAEREAGRLQPDELYVPLHIIDTNVRREQSPYVQYITQSPRAVILEDQDDDTVDLALLEKDLTKKIRFDGWQLSMFANIDGFQSNGYGVMEAVQDQSTPGEVGYEYVQYCDFGFISDTRDIQSVEMTARSYYFTRTRLLSLCGTPDKPDPENDWQREQVERLISREPEAPSIEASDAKDKSLYKVLKVMFRVNGIVNVAWCQPENCDDWLRKPRPLFIGRKVQSQPQQQGMLAKLGAMIGQQQQPQWVDAFETNYPYVIFPYLISENDTISQLKGRIFLDQDLQEAASSLLSSIVTKARRSAGLYFSNNTDDPNADLGMQKNTTLRHGSIINGKITSMELAAPDPGLFSALNVLITSNQNETSQVNFAVQNRKDSRKTAEEIKTANQQQQILSTVQVVLFSIALTQLYRILVSVIKSRVLSGTLKVTNPQVAQLYQRRFSVKPAGDVDVIEKAELIQKMMNAWQVVQNTAMAEIFLMDLLELMFPERISKYRAAVEQAKQQAQSQQAQQMQQMMGFAKQMADGIVQLSKHADYFSELGKLHALPVVQQVAQQIEQMTKAMTQQQKQ